MNYNYKITIERLDGNEQRLERKYGQEFFKMPEEEIGANILDLFSTLENDSDRTDQDYNEPDEGSPDHHLFVSEEERIENREMLTNLANQPLN